MMRKILAYLFCIVTIICLSTNLRASDVDNIVQDLNESEKDLKHVVTYTFDDIPQNVWRDHLVPVLRVGDFNQVQCASKRCYKILKDILVKNDSWKPVVARYYPVPMVNLLQGQYRHAVQQILQAKPRIDFYDFANIKEDTTITATSWDGTILIGRTLHKSDKSHMIRIDTSTNDMQILQDVDGATASDAYATN